MILFKLCIARDQSPMPNGWRLGIPLSLLSIICAYHTCSAWEPSKLPCWGTVWCWELTGDSYIQRLCTIHKKIPVLYLVPRISIILVYLCIYEFCMEWSVIPALNLHDVEKRIKFFPLVFGYCFRHEINISFLSLRKE